MGVRVIDPLAASGESSLAAKKRKSQVRTGRALMSVEFLQRQDVPTLFEGPVSPVAYLSTLSRLYLTLYLQKIAGLLER